MHGVLSPRMLCNVMMLAKGHSAGCWRNPTSPLPTCEATQEPKSMQPRRPRPACAPPSQQLDPPTPATTAHPPLPTSLLLHMHRAWAPLQVASMQPVRPLPPPPFRPLHTPLIPHAHVNPRRTYRRTRITPRGHQGPPAPGPPQQQPRRRYRRRRGRAACSAGAARPSF